MRRPNFYRGTIKNIFSIVQCLKDNDGGYITVSEIARRTGLHKWTVSRTVDTWMTGIVESVVPTEMEGIGMKVKFVRLANEDITDEQIVRLLKMRI